MRYGLGGAILGTLLVASITWFISNIPGEDWLRFIQSVWNDNLCDELMLYPLHPLSLIVGALAASSLVVFATVLIAISLDEARGYIYWGLPLLGLGCVLAVVVLPISAFLSRQFAQNFEVLVLLIALCVIGILEGGIFYVAATFLEEQLSKDAHTPASF